jgi:hypothetical protein
MSRKIRITVLALVAFLMLACSVTATTPSPGTNETQVAMQVQLTLQAGQQATMGAQLTQQSGQPPSQPTPIPPQIQPTNPPPPPVAQPTATPDIQQQMPNAKILVYEDTLDIGFWIKDSLNNMGLSYTHVSDAIGDFMSNLNSGINWDLIIVGAESKGGVQGEFWDVIADHINGNKKTALIAEIWYLDLVGEGRIKPVLANCGISYQRDWPLADSIYWLVPNSPVFNQPNTVMPFLHYSRYWADEAGDLIRLIPGSKATLLAGLQQNEKSSYGLIASCYDGRVIFQTFSNHDYRQNEVLLLWENYITYVLTNHFAVQP